MPSSPPERSRFGLLLRRADQAALAAAAGMALVSICLYWFFSGGARGRLIDIDRAEPAVVRFRVDINAADWPELAELPDVGETLARRIVDSRAAEGPFRSADDLGRVRGIGPKTLDGIKPYLLPLPERGNVAGK